MNIKSGMNIIRTKTVCWIKIETSSCFQLNRSHPNVDLIKTTFLKVLIFILKYNTMYGIEKWCSVTQNIINSIVSMHILLCIFEMLFFIQFLLCQHCKRSSHSYSVIFRWNTRRKINFRDIFNTFKYNLRVFQFYYFSMPLELSRFYYTTRYR